MAQCRIFLFTYNRNNLLQRSIKSLLNQTFTDWVCEVHNDNPSDVFPSSYISSLYDDRFIMHNHEVNLGPIKSFNLMYQGCEEQYLSLLEDDNWWEPEFLETIVKTLDQNPTIDLAWANMKYWQEKLNGAWEDMHETIWPISIKDNTRFTFPDIKQAFGAIHSNGAMLVRNKEISKYITPENIRFDFIEPVRERCFNYPIILLNKPLANFALTLQTNRKNSIKGFHEHQFLLLSSFCRYVAPTNRIALAMWADVRSSKVKSTNKLIYAGLLDENCRFLLNHVRFNDIIYFILYNIKRPSVFFNCYRAKKKYHEVWEYLNLHITNKLQNSKTLNA